MSPGNIVSIALGGPEFIIDVLTFETVRYFAVKLSKNILARTQQLVLPKLLSSFYPVFKFDQGLRDLQLLLLIFF